MTRLMTGAIVANGISLQYARTGGTKPPLVLAHGVTDAGLCWAPVAEALWDSFDVIMVDARGHGGSDAPDSGYDPVTQAADLHGLITGLALNKPAVLGHSMGAATALVLAGMYPTTPGAILLEDPPAWWSAVHEEESAHDRSAGMAAWLSSLKGKSRAELIAQCRAESPDWSEAELGPWADSKLRVSPNVAQIFAQRAESTVDWKGLLRQITCPALLITGDPSRGAIVTDATAVELRGYIPQLQIAHIAGAGHSIRRDRFDPYIAAVRTFLADHHR